MKSAIKTKLTKNQILSLVRERENEAWRKYQLFKSLDTSDAEDGVAKMFKNEWYEMYNLIYVLESAEQKKTAS
jgi:hypothetical protein